MQNIYNLISNYFSDNDFKNSGHYAWIALQSSDLDKIKAEIKLRSIIEITKEDKFDVSKINTKQCIIISAISSWSIIIPFWTDLSIECDRHTRKIDKWFISLSKHFPQAQFFYWLYIANFVQYGWGIYQNGKRESIFAFEGDWLEIIIKEGLNSQLEKLISNSSQPNAIKKPQIVDVSNQFNINVNDIDFTKVKIYIGERW